MKTAHRAVNLALILVLLIGASLVIAPASASPVQASAGTLEPPPARRNLLLGSSASIDPTTTDPALTWDPGNLAAQSTTFWVTFLIDPAVPTFTALPYSAALTLSSPELETANNTASGVVNTNLQVYLPMLKK
jgi:hypothetical protein